MSECGSGWLWEGVTQGLASHWDVPRTEASSESVFGVHTKKSEATKPQPHILIAPTNARTMGVMHFFFYSFTPRNVIKIVLRVRK